jgi:hypothetical protein
MKAVGDERRLWYRRSFALPGNWRRQRVLLHFDAIDWSARVWVNGKEVGAHQGGYDRFSLDITAALKPSRDQTIVVSVDDPTDAGTQPRGKQVRSPRSIWYTSTTGIWQTVWIEPVPAASIESLRLIPDIDRHVLRIDAKTTGDGEIRAIALDGSGTAGSASGPSGRPLDLAIAEPKLWSPDAPHLYDLRITLRVGGKDVDRVTSYFGMRKIALGKDPGGHTRLLLNNQPLFEFGPLDQGFWPDGLYTAPTDDALRFDIEQTKALGFNLARKHVRSSRTATILVRQARPARLAGHAERRPSVAADPVTSAARASASQFAGAHASLNSWPIIRRSSCGCRSTKDGDSRRRELFGSSGASIRPASSTVPKVDGSQRRRRSRRPQLP